MSIRTLSRDAVLRIGEVSEVNGRRIFITVDKNKNLSDLFLDGDILHNVSANSYIEIRKGFLNIIGRVEGERIVEDLAPKAAPYDETNKSKRILTIALCGYINRDGKFVGGTKELPLIGNEAFVLTREKIRLVHNLVDPKSGSINIAKLFGDDFDVSFPIDGLFNSHIAIFGNTGSGKSNTLAYLYQELLKALRTKNQPAFESNTRFVLFDFNGEYTGHDCISPHKKVYNLSTRKDDGDKLPLDKTGLLDIEILSILSDATDKTQKPFIARALKLLRHVYQTDEHERDEHFRNIVRQKVRSTLLMTEKEKAYLVLDYFREILPPRTENNEEIEIDEDLKWLHKSNQFVYVPGGENSYFGNNKELISQTELHQRVDMLALGDSLLSTFITFLYVQLISDVLANRAQNEHVAPVINRLKKKKDDIERLFDTTGNAKFWVSNFVVINLEDVNLDMKKTIPLLLSKKLYADHKAEGAGKSLTVIIDEAHNILSTESFREAESWKDYRLETFEEIIKEGRKFGVFVTLASQRPNDISPTITSQAHNYFIHRMINQRDLETISSAVSYIDRVTEESIPTLPTGTCVFSGVVCQVPMKIDVKPLTEKERPHSTTRQLNDLVPLNIFG